MLRRIYKYIKEKGFSSFIFRVKTVIMSRFFSSENIIEEKKQLYAYRYIKKYLYAMNNDIYADQDIGNNNPDTVWILWLQGIENAPTIVQKCVESVKRNCENHNIIILNSESIFDYIKLPDFIIEKYHSGIISPALYSDLIRVSLLTKYGGIWIDATCFFTDKIPHYINEPDFFCFKADMIYNHIIKGSSWFIKSKKDNTLLIKTRNILFEYLKKEQRVINYFIFHLTMSLVINNDEESREVWDSIPYICNMNPHVLQFHMTQKFNEEYWKCICSTTSIHKLTYKLTEKDFLCKESFLYKKILNK